LLGAPCHQTVMVITPEKITFICSQKRATQLEQLKQGDKQIPIEIVRRGKDIDENVPLYQDAIKFLNSVSSL
jgi:nucleosome binding factor SPN SPT16 subunit